MPTQKSATAKLAKKKLVIDRRRRDIVTTRMTKRLPIETKCMCRTWVYLIIGQEHVYMDEEKKRGFLS